MTEDRSLARPAPLDMAGATRAHNPVRVTRRVGEDSPDLFWVGRDVGVVGRHEV
ncbi:MAG: hypothetical protein AVDCRST_MAG17-1852 [uncultured Solirubrobacterales bacterium]|uniref:Uncharacterized protein n=1 Tax=uncultured Solirubrobacterales bacterium TaxID=768556 RepID=A0A6J4SXR6_9ACTN|nr:MAG: hypothetical protein AVDCRST_MAG17-1852 [uncultured Solirubrobacterales bacterium]